MRKGSGRPVTIRFWERVHTTEDGCWLWQGCRTGAGYGNFKLRRDRRVLAHRLSWELAYGPIPVACCVLHRCDVKLCVNPAHLWLGSQADNNRDRAEKGRNRDQRGERNSSAHLRLTDVIAIRDNYAARRESQSALARRYGTSQGHISRIVNRLEWEHI